MLRRKEDRLSISRVQSYATQDEFCRVFTEDENAIYLLSLLLTAQASKAEQCFVAGLEDSIQGNRVFSEWARSWSRRTIIKNAIRMISPAPGQVNGAPHVSDSEAVELDLGSALTAVLQLAPLERFVFVMSILEGYSIQECSILLSCTKEDVVNARARALQNIALLEAQRASPVVLGTDGASPAYFLEPAQVA
jgi:hypothetical protein